MTFKLLTQYDGLTQYDSRGSSLPPHSSWCPPYWAPYPLFHAPVHHRSLSRTSWPSSPKASQDLSLFLSSKQTLNQGITKGFDLLLKPSFDSQFSAQSYKRTLQINCLKSSFHDIALDSVTLLYNWRFSRYTLEIIWNLYCSIMTQRVLSFLWFTGTH